MTCTNRAEPMAQEKRCGPAPSDSENQSEPLQLISSMMHFANIVLRKVSAEPVPAAIMLEVEGAQ